MKKTIITIIIASLFTSYSVHAKRVHDEKFYQKKWCQEQNGEMEKKMNDGTRCDCYTETHAVEMDFANKLYEAIGQSLHYSVICGLENIFIRFVQL
jgi:hypothetical protein